MALTAHWKFDSSGVDSSGSGLDLTRYNTDVYIPGINSKGSYFNGSDQAWTRSNPNAAINFSTSTNFSISWWMKFNPGYGGGSFAIFCNFNNPTYNQGYEVYFTGSNNIILFIGSANRSLSFTALSLDRWYHMVMTAHRTTPALKLYVDGKYVTQNTDSLNQNATASSGKLVLGGEPDPTTTNPRALFNGSVDDFRVYSHELSAADVLSLYNSYHGQYQLTQGTIV